MKFYAAFLRVGMAISAFLLALVIYNFFTGAINEKLQHNGVSAVLIAGFGIAIAAFALLERKQKKIS